MLKKVKHCFTIYKKEVKKFLSIKNLPVATNYLQSNLRMNEFLNLLPLKPLSLSLQLKAT